MESSDINNNSKVQNPINMVSVYDKFEFLREFISDRNIVNELIRYMTTDDLKDFLEHLEDSFDINWE